MGIGVGSGGNSEKKAVGKTSLGESCGTHFTQPCAWIAGQIRVSLPVFFSALKQNVCTTAADGHSSRACHDDTRHWDGCRAMGHDELVMPPSHRHPRAPFFSTKIDQHCVYIWHVLFVCLYVRRRRNSSTICTLSCGVRLKEILSFTAFYVFWSYFRVSAVYLVSDYFSSSSSSFFFLFSNNCTVISWAHFNRQLNMPEKMLS